VFAGLADNPNLNLAHMKRQLNNLQVILFLCLISSLCESFDGALWKGLIEFESNISLFHLPISGKEGKHTISISIQAILWIDVNAKIFGESFPRRKREKREKWKNRIIFIREICTEMKVRCCWYFPSNPFKHQVSEVYRFEIANRK
jgi:hypothetical protein